MVFMQTTDSKEGLLLIILFLFVYFPQMEQIRITDMLKIQIEKGSTTHG